MVERLSPSQLGSNDLSSLAGLHLCETAIHKQFRSSDEAAVFGREEHDGLGDLIWSPKSAERDGGRDHLPALLAHF